MKKIILVIAIIAVVFCGIASLRAEEDGDIFGFFNRQPGTMPILPSYKISSYKELYQHPQIPGEVPEKYHKYLADNNLYTNEIHDGPYDVFIYKTLRFGKGQHILYTSIKNDSGPNYAFADNMRKAMDGSGKKFKPEEIWDMPADTKMYIYDITELRDKNSLLTGTESRIKFMSLRDKEEKIIWEYAYEDIFRKQGLRKVYDNKRILDIKRIEDGRYMLLMKYDDWANVLYVDTTMEPRVTEAYTVKDLAVVADNSGIYVYPKEGRILDDNFIWASYDDGKTKRCRVRYSTAQVIKNLIKSGGERMKDY